MTIDETHGMNGHSVAIGSDINGPITNGHAHRTNGLRTNGTSTNAAHMNGNSNTMNGANGSRPPISIPMVKFRSQFVQDGRCRVPESRYNIETYYSDMKKPGTVSTQYGYFLDESVDVGALDMSFFTMARSEVERADPQQRLMLEVAHEALEDAGVTDWRGKTIGTYIGNFGEDWLEMFREGNPAPSTDVQEALMRRAYELGGITDFSETAMVECHRTGTPTGDPIETRAVARVFGEKGVYISSVKPNLGHTKAASGLVSLLKMVKALQHHIIPPNIKFSIPNPSIPFEEGKLTVPTEATPWPKDRLERVSVNSFGIGGANAHVILESAATYNIPTAVSGFPESPQLLLFTANSSKSITRLVDNYKVWIEQNPDKICDLAYTLARKRTHLPYRAFAIVNNGVIESVSQPINSKSAGPPSIVMVFTGQGAQWPQMGRELLQSDEVFKSSIQSLNQQLQTIAGKKPHYSIKEELKKAGKQSRLSSAKFSQPLCTAIQIALVDTLKTAGIVPHAVVGHSSGEIAAAYATRALTAKEAITVAHHHGAVAVKQERPGTMAAIEMGWREIENYLIPNITIASTDSG
ncbi:phenolpthiocerol synthesis polyketide synthase ppsA [Coccidioides immitis RMSCC 3703]|uniref:Phenolpthiocerol synthesis polyketide synthase ppsA n=1 Tax=Coccidioides immitis RMSCC 3703 TaxID=454286 RepID=A0A0J8R3M0_COCIT|nr:phenolpthiocerol synthesis polyketide synthase ppsA [Coccidioides immitis RMSCC 3703]